MAAEMCRAYRQGQLAGRAHGNLFGPDMTHPQMLPVTTDSASRARTTSLTNPGFLTNILKEANESAQTLQTTEQMPY